MEYTQPTTAGHESIPLEARQHSVVDRFNEVVRLFPDLTAVSSRGKVINYQTINQSANRLAHALLAEINSPAPILLYLGQDIPAIIAILGILKTGRPYVALSPANSAERNALIVQDSCAEWIVTDEKHSDQAKNLAAGLPGLQTFDLGRIEHPTYRSENPSIPIPAANLAYIMYTSGSTNEPKGVMVDHAGLINQTIYQTSEYNVTTRDRIALFHNVSFAASRGSIFNALLCGAQVSIFDLRINNLDKAVRWLLEERITIFRSTPSTFRAIFRQARPGTVFRDLRAISIGGEAATKYDVSLYREHTREECVFYHRLGSTETDSMARLVIHHDTPVTDEILPVGLPVPEKEIRLIDEQGNPVGPGQIGEITVKGYYLSTGYWNRPDLTAERFRTDPADPGLRTFFTRDLARWRPDGKLEYLGRKDRRVKIRGFQVDLQAVEALLIQHPGINDIHVVARAAKHSIAEKQLLAYFTTAQGQQISQQALRQFLLNKVPDHMVPSRFVHLDALPLDSNGKVDHRALPDPPEGTDTTYLPPSTRIEKILSEIWAAAFDWQQVGVQDDFFDMGGDSLLAAEILTEVDAKFQQSLPLASFLEYRTIQAMAGFLEDAEKGKPRSSLLALRTRGGKPPLYLFPGHEGDVFYFRGLASMLGEDRPVYAVEMVIAGRESRPSIDLGITAARYLEEILALQPEGPYFLAGHSFGGKLAFEIARQITASGRQVAFLGLLDTYAPGSRQESDLPERISIHRDNLLDLSWQKRWEYLLDRLNNFLIKGMRLPTLKKLILATNLFRKDVSTFNRIASHAYQPGHYSGKIFLFRVRERPRYVRLDPTDGWQKHAGAVEIHDIPGNHANLLEPPQVSFLAQAMRDCLGQVIDQERSVD